MNDTELSKLHDFEIRQLALKFGCKANTELLHGEPTEEHKSETFTCETHGVKKVKVGLDGRMALAKMAGRDHDLIYTKTYYCDDCVNEHEAKVTAEKNAAVARLRKEKVDNQKISLGMSPRNLDITFDDFAVSNDKQAKALDTAKQICQMIKNKEKKIPNMIITGSVGTGKSMLASAMINDVFETGTVAMSTVIKIMREIKSTWKRDSEMDEQKLLDWYISRDILVIDEVGIQFDSDTEKLFIFDLIDGRYQHMKPTIIISNLDVNGIKACIGERCFDRLREDGGKLIGLDFESQRGKK